MSGAIPEGRLAGAGADDRWVVAEGVVGVTAALTDPPVVSPVRGLVVSVTFTNRSFPPL